MRFGLYDFVVFWAGKGVAFGSEVDLDDSTRGVQRISRSVMRNLENHEFARPKLVISSQDHAPHDRANDCAGNES